MALLGQWAGQSIICIGEGADPDNYPSGMFTEDEKQELSQRKDSNGMAQNLYWSFYEEDNPLQFKRWACDAAEVLGKKLESQVSLSLWPIWLTGPQFTWAASIQEYNKMKDAVRPNSSKFCPATQSWILRNLTTKEFVRAEGIALKPEYIDGPNIKGLGFGEAVISRISWSACSNVAMCYKGVC